MHNDQIPEMHFFCWISFTKASSPVQLSMSSEGREGRELNNLQL